MLRELSQLLDDLYDGLAAVQAREGVSLSGIEMVLPLELRPVFRDGGCVLLADVPRNSMADDWSAAPSRLHLSWTSADAMAKEAGP